MPTCKHHYSNLRNGTPCSVCPSLNYSGTVVEKEFQSLRDDLNTVPSKEDFTKMKSDMSEIKGNLTYIKNLLENDPKTGKKGFVKDMLELRDEYDKDKEQNTKQHIDYENRIRIIERKNNLTSNVFWKIIVGVISGITVWFLAKTGK